MKQTHDSMREDLELIEKNLDKLYRVAVEALERLSNALSSGVAIDLSANAALADHLRDTINTETLFFIAKWQPLGYELLYAEALIKVSYDLFRITRYANEIARTTRIAEGVKASEQVMAALSKALEMVKKAYKSFITRDRELASEVERLDSLVDEAYIKALEHIARSETVKPVQALECIILRQLERIADHATYIAREAKRIAYT